MEKNYSKVKAQPAHKLAIPLFLLASIPYFVTLGYDLLINEKPDLTFVWFGVFYLVLGTLYLAFKINSKKTESDNYSTLEVQDQSNIHG